MALVEEQYCELRPPRKGGVLAIGVTTTAQSYDLLPLDIGNDGAPPISPNEKPRYVNFWIQSDGNDVYFYFDNVASSVLSDTAQVAAGGTAAYADAYGAVIKAANSPIYMRINRNVDRFLVCKTKTGVSTLRMWAASEESC